MIALENGETRHRTVPLGECIYDPKDALLYVNKLLYIPDNEALQAKIINSSHEHPPTGHQGRAATFELILVALYAQNHSQIHQELRYPYKDQTCSSCTVRPPKTPGNPGPKLELDLHGLYHWPA